MVEDSFTGAGKRPLRDHAHKVLVPNGKNGISWLARLMPCGGKCLTGLFAVVGLLSFDVLSVKGITGLSVVCCCVMCIAPCSVLSRNGVLRIT